MRRIVDMHDLISELLDVMLEAMDAWYIVRGVGKGEAFSANFSGYIKNTLRSLGSSN